MSTEDNAYVNSDRYIPTTETDAEKVCTALRKKLRLANNRIYALEKQLPEAWEDGWKSRMNGEIKMNAHKAYFGNTNVNSLE